MVESIAPSQPLVYAPTRGTSYYLTRLTALLLLAGFLVLFPSLAAENYWPIEFFFDFFSTPFLIGCALAEVFLGHKAMQLFAPNEPLRGAWWVIRLSGMCHTAGLVLWHILGDDIALNPLLYGNSFWNEAMAREFQDAGYVVAGPLRMAVLAVGLGMVLRPMNRLIRPRVALSDYALLIPVLLFACYQVFAFLGRVVAAKTPETWASLMDGMNNPLLAVLLAQALMISRSLREMGGGLIARCWRAFAVGIVLTCLGTLGQWATNDYYLPWPYNSIVWYVWIPAAAAYALAPAYQLEAAWALRVVRLKPEPRRMRQAAARAARQAAATAPVLSSPASIEAATAAWREMLDEIPTTFGRLEMVSSSRIDGTAEYWHEMLERVPPGISTRLILDTHRRLFREWLGLSLAEKIRDMAEYLGPLRESQEHKANLKADWERLVPPSAQRADSLLFETDFGVALELTADWD